MIKIDWATFWYEQMGGWTILGWNVVVLMEGGYDGAFVGYEMRWCWDRKALSHRNCPNIFRTYNGRKIQEAINEHNKKYPTKPGTSF